MLASRELYKAFVSVFHLFIDKLLGSFWETSHQETFVGAAPLVLQLVGELVQMSLVLPPCSVTLLKVGVGDTGHV